jgi:hypothetical protein
LICQPCLARKEGSSSSPISFWEWQKWFKRLWKIDLREWLEKFQCLPVNADCAREWAKDRNHLASCQCLEIEAEKHYSLVNENLKVSRTKFRECQCVKSKKVRVSGDYYAWCDICEEGIKAASKKRVVKNRNDPRFWGLEVSEKILCGDCLVRFRVKMPAKRRAKFTEYRKLGMFE